jgi:hypothetical protein
MPYDNLSEALQDYIGQEKLRFEMTVDGINEVAKAIGYRGHQYANGSPLEEFLADNPGAQEALIEWISEQNLPDWREAVESELPDPDEDEDGDDDSGDDDLTETETETEVGGSLQQKSASLGNPML